MSRDASPPFDRYAPGGAGGEAPLVPLLHLDDDGLDADVLATWHEAISSALSADLPHELFALWLYPAAGGVALLGPAELAADHLDVPLPRPHVPQDRLWQLEERVRTAGFGSAICLPIRFGVADVGLMLLARLEAGSYGPRQAVVLQQVALRLAPSLARIARLWTGPARTGETERPTIDVIVADVVAAIDGARTPRDFAHGIFGALARAIPHERAELLIPGVAAEQWYRMGEHPAGPLWTDPELVISREHVDVAALFEGGDRVLVADAKRDPRWHGWHLTLGSLRSVVGVRLAFAGRPVGYLLLGSSGPDLYREQDLDVLHKVGTLVAPRVENFVLGWHLQVLRTQLGTLRSVPAHVSRISDILAATADSADALRRFATEAAVVLPTDRMRFALTVDDDRRVVIVTPADADQLGAMPAAAIEGTALGQVVEGELPAVLVTRDLETVIVVPLRVAGRVFGAMELTALGAATYSRSDLTMAQQLADAVSPHLDALRTWAARRAGGTADRAGRPGAESFPGG